MMREENAVRTPMTATANAVRHIHHHAYACWDSEVTRHFYEDVLGMPLVATIVIADPLRTDGSMYCHTFFEIADSMVRQFKGKLDAAGVAHGSRSVFLSALQ